jgi:cytoskeletal protein CcmA (bactofilin family)
MLIVSETGDIEADIEAGVVICKGRVKGNISRFDVRFDISGLTDDKHIPRFYTTLELPIDAQSTFKTQLFSIVSETGDIEADIEAGIVVCKGRVKGNILASQKIEMHPKSTVIGDGQTQSV